MKPMENKTALVTGAGSGMGLAAAWAFAEQGATVILADINDSKMKAEEIVSAGYKAISITLDVSDEGEVQSAIAYIITHFGRLDYAFNNAGIQSPAMDMTDVSEMEYDRVLNVNLKGIWNCMKHELIEMRRQGFGAIVNNSSLGGLVGLPGRAAYHASKHGVIGLTKSAALEYATRGIRINAVCPGVIRTPMVELMLEAEPDAMELILKDVPIDRLGKAEEVASVVLFLCSDAASYIIGQAIAIDGGYTVH